MTSLAVLGAASANAMDNVSEPVPVVHSQVHTNGSISGGPVDVDVAVIGAGPGGLATAIALMRQGLTVRVYEKATVLRPAGSMVGLQPNGYKALQAVDPAVCEAVLGVGIEPEFMSLCNNEGVELKRTSFREANLKRMEEYGAPFKWVFWYRLQQALLKFLPEDALCVNKKFVRFEESEECVSVWFDGEEAPVRARLLIGADGGRSIVRQQLLSDGPPTYTGAMTWRGNVEAADVSEFGVEPLGFYWMMGGGATFAVVEQGTGEMLWILAAEVGWETAGANLAGDQGGGGTWASENPEERPSEKAPVEAGKENGTAEAATENVGGTQTAKNDGANGVLDGMANGQTSSGDKPDAEKVATHPTTQKFEAKKRDRGEEIVARALDVMAKWPERVRAVVKATDPAGVVETGVYHRAPVDRWCSKRVALVGDAAHIMRPTLGQATSQAFEDALVLAREVAKVWGSGADGSEDGKERSPEAALDAYMDLRRDRVARLQLQAAEVGKTAYKEGAREAAARNRNQDELDWKLVMPY